MSTEFIGLIKELRTLLPDGNWWNIMWILGITLVAAIAIGLIGLIGYLIVWLIWKCLWILVGLTWLCGILFASNK